MKKVDLLDRKILRVITIDARRSFKEIAEECGVSRAAIHQRVARMVERGIITGSGYQANPKFLGFTTCAYVGVKLERGTLYQNVVDQLSRIPEVVEAHLTTGTFAMYLKIYTRDNEHLKDVLNDKLMIIDGVGATETLISLEQCIQRSIPIFIESNDGKSVEVATCSCGTHPHE